MNGVINIITKKTADTQGAIITADGGSFERSFAGTHFGGKLGGNTPFRVMPKVSHATTPRPYQASTQMIPGTQP